MSILVHPRISIVRTKGLNMVRAALFVLTCSAASASAAFIGNLNYFSPSLHHPSLGVSINKVARRTTPHSPWDPAKLSFTHGVASGDPYDDSVILWTRAAPTSDNDRENITVSGIAPLFDHDNDGYVAKSDSPVCVAWKISTSENFTEVADSGTVFTSSDVDYTVKVEAKKLKSFTNYCEKAASPLRPHRTRTNTGMPPDYQFSICDSSNTSPLGRTKTIPSARDKVTSAIKLAIYSCSNFRESSCERLLFNRLIPVQLSVSSTRTAIQ